MSGTTRPGRGREKRLGREGRQGMSGTAGRLVKEETSMNGTGRPAPSYREGI
jgi:hypothetical protein